MEMTILDILREANLNLRNCLNNEPQKTKEYFMEIENRKRAEDFFNSKREGMEKYRVAVLNASDRAKWARTTLEDIADGANTEDVGMFVSRIISKEDIFLQRLHTDNKPIHIYEDLYFFPFEDGQALYGHMTKLPNDTIFFQGILVFDDYEYPFIKIVETDWIFLNGRQ